MNVIAKKALEDAAAKHADAAGWIWAWYKIAQKARWTKLLDVQKDYPTTDQYCRCLIFDARGNKYRLICRVVYADRWNNGTLFIKAFVTHADYDKDSWKPDCM